MYSVSEFYRQTFRADFIITNKHKILIITNTYGVKKAPVQRTDKLKNPRYSDRNCFYVFCRLSRKLSIFYPICIKSFMPIFDHRIGPESLFVEF
jgi:hypothetical protein